MCKYLSLMTGSTIDMTVFSVFLRTKLDEEMMMWLRRLPELCAVRERDGRFPHRTAARLVVTGHTRAHKRKRMLIQPVHKSTENIKGPIFCKIHRTNVF